MSKTRFWKMGSPDSERLLAWEADEVDYESIRCPVDSGHQRIGRRTTDLSVELVAYPVADIVWTWYSDCLIQDHVLEAFREAGLTGFEVKPVKARFKSKRHRDKEPPRLWELVVTGSAGMPPPESGVRLIERCEACGAEDYTAWTDASKLIDEKQWDGSDFFKLRIYGYKFVTERVVDCIRRHEFLHVKFTPVEELKPVFRR